MTRNTARGSYPFVQTSQHRFFDDMIRMLKSFKHSRIMVTPDCPHNTQWNHLPISTSDTGVLHITVFGIIEEAPNKANTKDPVSLVTKQ